MQIIKKLIPESERKKVPEDVLKLQFGKFFTDRVLIQKYQDGKWGDAVIQKLDNLSLHPDSIVLHYEQEIFEGAKCFLNKSGKITFFYIHDNIRRMNYGSKKVCIPQLDVEFTLKGIRELVFVERRYVPTQEGCSVYIHPFMIASEVGLGVRLGSEYIFQVILFIANAYYPEVFNPVKIYSCDAYSRGVLKGTDDIKCGGNFAGSFAVGEEAYEHGCSQFLWLDAETHTKVEEVRPINAFFVKDVLVYTSPLTRTILPGITRDCIIQIYKTEGISIKEEQLKIGDVIQSIDNGILTEMFKSRTTTSVCPISELVYKDKYHAINKGEVGPITKRLYDMIIDIQCGRVEEKYHWVIFLEE